MGMAHQPHHHAPMLLEPFQSAGGSQRPELADNFPLSAFGEPPEQYSIRGGGGFVVPMGGGLPVGERHPNGADQDWARGGGGMPGGGGMSGGDGKDQGWPRAGDPQLNLPFGAAPFDQPRFDQSRIGQSRMGVPLAPQESPFESSFGGDGASALSRLGGDGGSAFSAHARAPGEASFLTAMPGGGRNANDGGFSERSMLSPRGGAGAEVLPWMQEAGAIDDMLAEASSPAPFRGLGGYSRAGVGEGNPHLAFGRFEGRFGAGDAEGGAGQYHADPHGSAFMSIPDSPGKPDVWAAPEPPARAHKPPKAAPRESRKLCMWGTKCRSRNCKFGHPERGEGQGGPGGDGAGEEGGAGGRSCFQCGAACDTPDDVAGIGLCFQCVSSQLGELPALQGADAPHLSHLAHSVEGYAQGYDFLQDYAGGAPHAGVLGAQKQRSRVKCRHGAKCLSAMCHFLHPGEDLEASP